VINVYRIPLPKESLRAMSKDERVLVLLLGYAANQIAMMCKLVMFATNKTPEDRVEQNAASVQTQMLARLTIGVANEAWELVRTRFLESLVGKEYATRLNANGQQALARLKGVFASSNMLSKIRTNYAFHHPRSDSVERAFEVTCSASEFDDDWNIYLSDNNLNSMFFISDLVILHGILDVTDESNLIAAQERVMNEVAKVAEALTIFAFSFLEAVIVKHFNAQLAVELCAKLNAPNVMDPYLPFFVQANSASNSLPLAG
jgi:hypothetical protein